MDTTTAGVSRREEALQAIRARRTQGMDAGNEIHEGDGHINEHAPKTVETISFVDPDGKEYRVPITAAAKLKIDGEEIETPVDVMSRRYQKGAAGDKRLQEANIARQELERKEKALAQKEAEIAARQTQKPAATTVENQGPDETDFSELTDAIIEADEEKLKKLLPKLAQRPQVTEKPSQPLPDVESIVDKKLTERALVNDLKTAQDKFYDVYADLAEDSALFDMVDAKTLEIRKTKPSASAWDVISEAAESVRKWRDGLATGDSKKIRKRAIPTPASGRASLGQDPPPPQTHKERLNEIRKTRGQPPL